MPSNSTSNREDEAFVIATGNPGKRREFEELLGEFLAPQWTIYDRHSFPEPLQEVEETGETFRENAIKKAMETAQTTGCVCLSDDSGLVVDALGGNPGVKSARFAGENATDEENNRLLVEQLESVSPKDRTARFVAVLCLALPENRVSRTLLARRGTIYDEIEPAAPRSEAQLVRIGDLAVVWFQGTVEGLIVDKPCGDQGFGYDPHFFGPQWGKTMAQVSPSRKNRISHRATAAQKMIDFFS